MKMVIAFIGYNKILTRRAFDQFLFHNKECILVRREFEAELKDGWIIRAIWPTDGSRMFRCHQIIIADDSRWRILLDHYMFFTHIVSKMRIGEVPDEYFVQFFNTDEI